MRSPMRPPPIDPAAHRDALEITAWKGLRISADRLYHTLTELGWKVDTEESNLMNGLSKTWREAGIKVWVRLENFVCAPPDGEDEAFDTICFYRFDPSTMPTETMYERIYSPGDEQEPWFPGHREEWDWLVTHGDPQFETFDRLEAVPLRDVPEPLVLETLLELHEAVELAD